MQSEHQNALSPRTSPSVIGLSLDPAQHGASGSVSAAAYAQYQSPSVVSSGSCDSGGCDLHDANPMRTLTGHPRTPAKKQPGGRISDYENALAPTTPRIERDGPEFKVVKSAVSRLGMVKLEAFPNEILTHILANLPAASLEAVSLVCRRFYELVTTPHAWREAFSNVFRIDLDDSWNSQNHRKTSLTSDEDSPGQRLEARSFTRLTSLATWRSEYILRTRLLRALSRGKPAYIGSSQVAANRSHHLSARANASITYNSQLFALINHIEANWGSGKKSPHFIHGTDETGTACTSDPNLGKVDAWGLSDPQSLPQFADLFPGDASYGLGAGQLVGVRNSMDVSQQYGLIYGEGFPGGQTYYRATDEMRGRFLPRPSTISTHMLGAPRVPELSDSICCVWIAKSSSIPTATKGLVGMLTGSSSGIVSAYSLDDDSNSEHRPGKGTLTCSWVLSPGVPIVALSVDDSYSSRRSEMRRIWAVVLNALGEVFYLRRIPTMEATGRKSATRIAGQSDGGWSTGRSVFWEFVEPSRRIAKLDPYKEFQYDGSYSPRSSCVDMLLSDEQIVAETREIEKFMAFPPAHFRKICHGWNMHRRLEVDFGGDDGHGAGENIIVICNGGSRSVSASVMRYSRLRIEDTSRGLVPAPKTPPLAPVAVPMSSLFGGGTSKNHDSAAKVTRAVTEHGETTERMLEEDWRSTQLALPMKSFEITTSTLDTSVHALSTTAEDPLMTSKSNVQNVVNSQISSLPGGRSRFIAVGTKTGSIILWDVRGTQSMNSTVANTLQPIRIISTDSPEISCLAMSALFVIHGGNDGLVQAWDPLGSSLQPIRTLNSRFSSQARRRLIQAQASPRGVGINLYAAGAITIDPDPTVLRGMMSLGTHLRYWSYNSNEADGTSSKKRRLRRSSDRGSNATPDRFTNSGRGVLHDYIATEQEEMRSDRDRRAREEAHLRGRFGVDFADMTEEEALQYAELISRETFENEARHQDGDTQPTSQVGSPGSISTASFTNHGTEPQYKHQDEWDAEVEEAIRLSLLENREDSHAPVIGAHSRDVPITSKPRTPRRPAHRASTPATQYEQIDAEDLDFVLQLSLAEEESKQASVGTSRVRGNGGYHEHV